MLVFLSVLGDAYHETTYMREDLSEEYLELLKIRWAYPRRGLSAGGSSMELYGIMLISRAAYNRS